MDTLLLYLLMMLESPIPIAVLKASLLLALAIWANACLRHASASTRHFLITAVIFLAAAAPAVLWILPDWRVPLPVSVSSYETMADTVDEVSAETSAGVFAPQKDVTEDRWDIKRANAATSSTILLYLWLAGTGLTLARTMIGVASFWRIRNRTVANADVRLKDIQRIASAALSSLGLRRGVEIVISDKARVPQVSGLFKPAIVMPEQARHWPDGRLRSVLMHELAHISRRDHITWPLANLAVAWLWFNPLVWIALAQMRREREKACDDHVLSSGTPSIGYARHLLGVCASVRTPARLAAAGLAFARKNDIEERIKHMLNNNVNRRPMSLKRRLLTTALVFALLTPFVGVNGFKVDTRLSNVTPAERDAIVTTLAEFYAELSAGSDYHVLRERFLTSDYFDSPTLTLENLDRAVWRIAFDNTLSLLLDQKVTPAKEVRGRIISIHREKDEYIVTQHLNVMAQRVTGAVSHEDEYGDIVIEAQSNSSQSPAVEDCHLVKALGHQIRFRMEDGMWKISRLDDGVALMRMDTDNPYGPIFLFWMEDIDSQTTPYGPGIVKIIPVDVVPDATNTKFILEK
ncbi:MAG: M56 family metallopeptidase [Candidatus Zixiibacteriota bacterium]|nr:MAG: M56 family metallopeptidase [candidate division Zixibacteria bacterium]